MKIVSLKEFGYNYKTKIEEAEKASVINIEDFSFRDIVNSILPGEIVVIAGRPGMGKTRFLYNLLINQAVKKDEKVLLISLKNKSEICFLRIRKLLSSLKAEDNSENILINHKLFKNFKSFNQFMKKAIKKYRPKAVYIDNLNSLSVLHDLLSEMSADNYISYFDMFNNDIAVLFKYLEKIAAKYEVPIVLTDELIKDLEFRGGIINPVLKDLFTPGIEIFAHKVILLNSLHYYGFTEDEFGNSTKDILEVTIAKNSNGVIMDNINLKISNDIII